MSWVPIDSLFYTISTVNSTTLDVNIYTRSANYTVSDFINAGYSLADILSPSVVGFTLAQVNAAGISVSSVLALGGIYTISYCKTTGGYTATQFNSAGVSATDMQSSGAFTVAELYAGGYTSTSMRAAGYTATQLRSGGYSATQCYTAGYTASESTAAGFTVSELRTATYSASALKATGSFTATQMRTGGFTASEMAAAFYTATELYTAGYTSTQVKTTNAFTLAEVKAAGYTLTELKTAGYTASELKAVSYTASELKYVGFTATELYDASFTATESLQAGYALTDVRTAGYTAAQVKTSGLATVAQMRTAGYTATNMKAALYTATELYNGGYSASQLKVASYTASELKTGGFTLAQIKTAGYTASECKVAEFTGTECAAAGFTATELRVASFTVAEIQSSFSIAQLKTAGYTASEMRSSGNFTITQLKLNSYTLAEMYAGGYTAAEQYAAAAYTTLELKNVGYTLSQLISGGYSAASHFVLNGDLVFTIAQLLAAAPAVNYTATDFYQAGVRPSDLLADNRYSYANLHDAGYSATQLYQTNATASQLRTAGYTATELKVTGGYTISDLRVAGYTVTQIRDAGYTNEELAAAGFTATQLKADGFTASQLRSYGFGVSEVKAASYTDSEVINAGYTVPEYVSSGLFSASQMRTLGSFSVSQLLVAGGGGGGGGGGFSRLQVVTAGFSATELRVGGGYTIDDLSQVGFTVAQIAAAGFSATSLRAINFGTTYTATVLRPYGYSVATLRAGGYTFSNVYTAGFSTTELLTGGYSATAIKSSTAGNVYTSAQLRSFGYTATDLKTANYTDILQAGYSATELREAGYTIANLKAVPLLYSVSDIMNAGYTIFQVRAEGYFASEARLGPYSAAQLKSAGYSDAAILVLSFSAADLRALNYTSTQLIATGMYTAAQLKSGGYSDADILTGGFSASQLRLAGYSVIQLKESGANVTAAQAREGGYTDSQIVAARYIAAQLRALSISATTLYAGGYTIVELLSGGYTNQEIATAGFTITQLRTAGFTVTLMRESGYTMAQLLLNGYTASAVLAGGFSAEELRTVGGYSAAQLQANGYSVAQLKAGGYTDNQILTAGYPAVSLRSAAYTATQLRQTGLYSIADLRAAKYTDTQLLTAGFTIAALKSDGVFSPAQVRSVGNYTVNQMMLVSSPGAGFSEAQVLSAGFSAAQLYGSGLFNQAATLANSTFYTAAQLKPVYPAADIVASEAYTVTELKTAGFTAAEIKPLIDEQSPDILIAAGFTMLQVAAAGFSATALKTAANIPASILQQSGQYTIDQLLVAYTSAEVLAAGFTASQLKASQQFSAADLAASTRYSLSQLRAAGFDDADLLAITDPSVPSIADLIGAGFTLEQIATLYSVSTILANPAANAVGGNLSVTQWTANTSLSPPPTLAQLRSIGQYSLTQLKTVFSTEDILAAVADDPTLFSTALLRTEGNYTAAQLRSVGFTASDCRLGGYTIAQLEDNQQSANGYSATEIVQAGFLAVQLLQQQHYSASQLKSIGNYTATQLRNAGFADADILSIGYDAAELSLAKYTVEEMQAYGYSDGAILSGLSNITEIVPPTPVVTQVEPGNKRVRIASSSHVDTTVIGYKYSLDNGVTFQWSPSFRPPIEIPALVNGQTYDILLRSVSITQDSTSTVISQVTPVSVPEAPVLLSVTGTDSVWTLRLLNGFDNGSPLLAMTPYLIDIDGLATDWTDYTIVEGAGADADAVTTLELDISSLSDMVVGNTYPVKVRSQNSVGSSLAWSNAMSVVPQTAAEPPTIDLVLTDDRRVSLMVTPGAENGGGSVLYYQYTLDDGVHWYFTSTLTSPIPILGLTNGTSYTLKLRSGNLAGLSSPSDPISFVPKTIPAKPVVTSASLFSDRLDIAFVVPSTGGSEITEYRVSLDNGGSPYLTDGNGEVELADVGDGILTILRTQLAAFESAAAAAGGAFQVKVVVGNEIGLSEASDTVASTFLVVPSRPVILDAQAADQSVVLRFAAPLDANEVVTHYKYVLNGDMSVEYFIHQNTSPVRIFGLDNNVPYTIAIAAVNNAGSSQYSLFTPELTPFSYPNPPVITLVEPLNGACRVHFDPLEGNGAEVVAVKYFDGSRFLDLSGGVTSPLIIPNLVNKTVYPISIACVNAGGMSRSSNVVSIVPGVPVPPTITRIEPLNREVNIYFTPPDGTENGNVPAPTSFMISIDDGKTFTKALSNASPLNIKRLVNGVSYPVYLQATNVHGTSANSNRVIALPRSAPSRPAIRSVTPIFQSASVSAAQLIFIPPDANGADITAYKWAYAGTPNQIQGTVTLDDSVEAGGYGSIAGLPINTLYSIVLYAENEVGLSPVSAAYKPVMFKYTVPAAPRITGITVNATTGDTTVTFSRPAENGSPISTYLYAISSSGSSWTTAPGANVIPVVIPSAAIPKNTPFTVQLMARNEVGDSIASVASKQVTYTYLPPRTARITRIQGFNQGLRIFFAPGLLQGAAITGYQISLDRGTTFTSSLSLYTAQTATSTEQYIELVSTQDMPLNNDVVYNVCIRAATLDAGESALSNIMAGTPCYRAPDDVVITSVIPKNNGGLVTFTLRGDGGSAITSLRYRLDTTATDIYTIPSQNIQFQMLTSTVGTATISEGMTNGTPVNALAIQAVNEIGASLWTIKPVAFTPIYTVPSAPVILSVVPGRQLAKLVHRLALPNGGTISDYLFELNNSGVWISSGGNVRGSFTIPFLTTGQTYTVRILAKNELGEGTPSAPSSSFVVL